MVFSIYKRNRFKKYFRIFKKLGGYYLDQPAMPHPHRKLADIFAPYISHILLLRDLNALQNRQTDGQPTRNVSPTRPTAAATKQCSSNNMNGAAPKPIIIEEKPESVRMHPVQAADRNLVHVTKAQMKGKICTEAAILCYKSQSKGNFDEIIIIIICIGYI